MNSNIIPKDYAEVVALALRAHAGAQNHGPSAGVLHNPASRIAANLFDLTGDPATPALPGKQAQLDAQLLALKTSQAALDAVRQAARNFCHLGLGVLKPRLGHRWNSDWLAAGFTVPSLAVPRVPLHLLLELRTYLRANPGQEAASLGFTAAQAQAHVEAIQSATTVRNTAKGARWTVKAARDAAFRQLRRRLSDLRAELAQLLAPSDDRWNAFGFRRPADGRQPARVKSVTVTPLNETTVQVRWLRAKHAESYRVSWRRASDAPDSATEIGLVSDTQCTLTDLPPDQPLIVAISARNASGETVPTYFAHTIDQAVSPPDATDRHGGAS